MATTTDVLTRDKLYIGGEWVDPAGTGTIEVVNPTTEQVIGSVPEGTADDADRAVKAARAAFDSWSATSPYERAGYCAAIRRAPAATCRRTCASSARCVVRTSCGSVSEYQGTAWPASSIVTWPEP